MEGEKELDLIIKLVHGEGPSRITLDSNRQIASCGLDSISVVFHNGGLEEDNYQFDVESIVGVAGDVNSILDIACYNQGEEYMVAVATDDHTVLSYSYCSGNLNDDPFAESQFKAILVRFTSQINTIDVSSDSSRLAAGASDFLVKMVDLTDTSKISTMEGHDAPVLCVRFDPLVKYLASSSCDGTVKIWSTESKVIVYSVDVFPKVNDIIFASTLCRFSWQPGQGQVIAVPVGDGVRLLKRESWNCIQTINEQDERNEKFDHVTCWSPCGTMFAVGSSDGRISIYGGWPQPSLLSRQSVGSHVVSSLCWDPKTKDSSHPLLFSSSSGHIGALPHHWVYPQGEKETGKESTAGTSNTGPANTVKATVAEPDDPWFDDSLLLEGIPPDSIFNDEEDAQELANCRPAPSHSPPPLPPPVTARTTNQINDKRIHDDDNEVAPPTKRRNVILSDTEEERLDPLSPVISSTVDTGGVLPAPPPLVSSPLPPPHPLEHYHEIFQPSATPSHLTNRFLVYNMVGVVRYHDDGSSPMVEIEFHDSSVHHPLSIPNHYGWTMGALSSKALVLAVEKTEEEPSQFQCTVFSSWDQNKDWSQQLPKGESIEVVALGDSWVAVATDKNYIRLFSLGGTQREVISIPGGQVVSLAGKGDQLIIIYQESTKSSLTAWVLDIGQRRELYPPHHLPLTPQAKLEWIGFSECGVPISYDTKGIVRMFSNQYGLSWLPIVDSSSLLNQKGDHYFVVGMTHNPNEMRVILCKGLDYPPVQPRPVMTTIPLTFPLCDPKTEKTNIEAQCIEKQFVHPPDVMPSPTEMLRTLMQLMAIACRSNHEFRAFELVDMMTLEQGLELALQYASQSGHFRLARQISNLKERRAIAAATEEEEEEEEETNNYYTHRRQAESSSSAYEPSGRSYHDSRRSASTSKSTSQEPKDSGRTPLSARRMLLLKPANKENKPETPEESKEEEEEEEEEENKEAAAETSLTNEGGGGGEESDLVSNNSLELINESTDVITGMTGSIDSQFTSPQVSKQRTSNPFKRATPVSKQIQVDRRSSFLDKISQEVQEEKEKEKQKKMKSKLKPANAITTKAKGKKKNTGGSSNNNNAKLAAFAFTKKS